MKDQFKENTRWPKWRPMCGLMVCTILSLLFTIGHGQNAQGWQGASIQAFVKQWGEPDEKRPGQFGHILYIYHLERYHTANSNAPMNPQIGANVSPQGRPVIIVQPNVQGQIQRPLSLSCTVIFVVNKQGTIISSNTYGNGCNGL